MTTRMKAAARERIEHSEQVLRDSGAESERIKETLEESKKVRRRALPILRRAGYLKS